MRMHGGRIYEYAERSGRMPEEILDFSANINPLGPPVSVMAAIHTAMKSVSHYPDSRHTAVKAVLSQRFEIDGQAVFCGNGASEVIDLTIRQMRPERIFVFEPAFAQYELTAHRVGAAIVHVPLHGDFSLANILDRIKPSPSRGDMVIYNNPHNPTGHLWKRQEWVEVLQELCSRGVVALIDESFMDFRWDEDDLTLISWVKDMKTVVVIRSATKMYAIPGLRFGFGIAHPDIVHRIESYRDHWSVNHFAQAAAIAAYQDTAFVKQTWQWLQSEQAYIGQTWGNHPAVRLYAPSVNYFLVELSSNIDSERITHSLEAEGIFVRRCEDFRCLDNRYLRIAMKSHVHNERLWHAFTRLSDQVL